uniref:Notewaprin-b-like n=1 Tax=Crassostrea virginica TaxID=6565 RepID=A0A8B8AKY3_CRAVI|nr:notewaprin-b-like [Crassostrea virginica]
MGNIAHDKLIKPGVCPYLSLAILRSCSSDCTGDSTCEGDRKCCYNGCARTCVDPGYSFVTLSSVMSPFSTTPVTTYSRTRETTKQSTVASLGV